MLQKVCARAIFPGPSLMNFSKNSWRQGKSVKRVQLTLFKVIGTAIALNLLSDKIPLVAGCALSILDVFLILLFYRPSGSMKGLQAFEIFVAVLVLGVVVSFCLELSLIKHVSVGEVFRGYLPSSAIVESQGWVRKPISRSSFLNSDFIRNPSFLMPQIAYIKPAES